MAENNTNQNFLKEEESTITISEIWDLVWGHKWWYVASVAVFLILGVFYLYRTPKVYNRTAKVMIDESNQDATMRNLGVASAGMMRMRSINAVENEMEAFSSPDLMQVVVERLNLQTRYVEQQLLRNVELYQNSPFELILVGENPMSGFSFLVENKGEGKVALSKFHIREEKLTDVVTGNLGDTLQTPFGAMILVPMEGTENMFKHPIAVSWAPSMTIAKGYANRINMALSSKESSVIVMSLNDTYPSRAASILTTLIDVYNEVWISNKNRSAINTTEFINERLVIIESDLADVEDDLKQYKSSNNLTDMKSAAQSYITESSHYAAKSFEVNNQLSVAEFIRSYLNDPVNSMNLIPSNLGLTSAPVENQIKEYNEIVLQRDRLIAGSGEKNPLIADMNASIASIRSAIIRSIDNLVATLTLQKQKIESQEKQILNRMSSSSGQELQLLSIERKQQITQNLYMFLLEKREENELAALINVGNTRVIMNPNGPSVPVSPNKMMIAFAMLVLGFGIPFGVFFLIKMLDKTIRNRADLGNLTVPFLAEIPKYVKKEDRHKKLKFRHEQLGKNESVIVVKQGSRDMMNEAYRVLRTNIDLMLGRGTGAKVIMLTSFNPNAGKTFSIMNIAASMALKGSKVIMVDLDLRKASLTQSLNVNHSGVAACLNGKVEDYHECIDEISQNLYLLPSGTLPPNPTELLLSDKFTQLIEALRGEYDYVFLDCPPIDIVADASIITEVADMSIFVMRANQMTKDVLPQVQALYNDRKYKHMAMILNSVEIQYKKYGYGKSSYGYGYGYQESK